MIKVLYFASLREALGSPGEEIALPTGVNDVGELRARLAQRGEPWTALTGTKNLRAAVNQTMVADAATLRDGDEIAFFPPVTGG
jgi:sulfur-carrier protein